jgi:hypothetical protein
MDKILSKTNPARQKFFKQNEQLLHELAEVGQFPADVFIG